MKTIKLLSFIIILLGSVMSGSVWAVARSGGGHTNGSDHSAAGSPLTGTGGPQFSRGQPYASGVQIARRGGRSGARGVGRGGARSGGRHMGRGGRIGARQASRSVNRSVRSGGRHVGRGGRIGVRQTRSISRSLNRSRNISNIRNFSVGRSFSRGTNYGSYRDAKAGIQSYSDNKRQIVFGKKVSTTKIAQRGGGARSGGGARAGGRGFNGGRSFRGSRGFSGGRSFRGGRGFRGGNHRHYGRGFRGGHRHYGRGYYGRWWPYYSFGFGLGYGYGGYWPYYGYGGYWPYYGGYGYNDYGYGYDDDYPPVVYIQREDNAQGKAELQTNYWHYCRNPEGYYPYVKKCPDGWLPVAPLPPTTSNAPAEDSTASTVPTTQ